MPPQDKLSSAADDEVIIDDEEEEDDRKPAARGGRKKKHKHHHHKKLKMGDESGLTEDDRRRLRREQRDVAKMLQDGLAINDAESEDKNNFVQKARTRNNELFQNVRYTREAVLDAENVENIAAKLSKQVDEIVQVASYDAAKFVVKLKSKLKAVDSSGQSFFDWHTLGLQAGVCFNAVPSRITFLAGPIDNVDLPEKKTRAVRQKRVHVEEELVEEKPEELANKKQKKTSDQLSQAERNLKQMNKILRNRCEEVFKENMTKYQEIKEKEPDKEVQARNAINERGSEIDFVRFLVNPHSFTQTVENIFNFSFMIKKGNAKIKMRKAEPMGDSTANNPLDLALAGCFVGLGEDDHDGPARQCVMPFTMKDWRKLVQAYELDKCDVPHRKGSKQSLPSSQQSRSPCEEEE